MAFPTAVVDPSPRSTDTSLFYDCDSSKFPERAAVVIVRGDGGTSPALGLQGPDPGAHDSPSASTVDSFYSMNGDMGAEKAERAKEPPILAEVAGPPRVEAAVPPSAFGPAPIPPVDFSLSLGEWDFEPSTPASVRDADAGSEWSQNPAHLQFRHLSASVRETLEDRRVSAATAAPQRRAKNFIAANIRAASKGRRSRVRAAPIPHAPVPAFSPPPYPRRGSVVHKETPSFTIGDWLSGDMGHGDAGVSLAPAPPSFSHPPTPLLPPLLPPPPASRRPRAVKKTTAPARAPPSPPPPPFMPTPAPSPPSSPPSPPPSPPSPPTVDGAVPEASVQSQGEDGGAAQTPPETTAKDREGKEDRGRSSQQQLVVPRRSSRSREHVRVIVPPPPFAQSFVLSMRQLLRDSSAELGEVCFSAFTRFKGKAVTPACLLPLGQAVALLLFDGRSSIMAPEPETPEDAVRLLCLRGLRERLGEADPRWFSPSVARRLRELMQQCRIANAHTHIPEVTKVMAWLAAYVKLLNYYHTHRFHQPACRGLPVSLPAGPPDEQDDDVIQLQSHTHTHTPHKQAKCPLPPSPAWFQDSYEVLAAESPHPRASKPQRRT